jgi:hypothetical protein
VCPLNVAVAGGGSRWSIPSLSPFLTLALVVGAAASQVATSTQRVTTCYVPFQPKSPTCI